METIGNKVNTTEREGNLIAMYIGNNQDWLEYCHEVFNHVYWIAEIEADMRSIGADDEDIEKDIDGMIDLVSQGSEAYINSRKGE